MSNIVNKLYQNNTIIYKVILFLVATTAIVYFFPKGGQFKYDFSNGQLWKYDNLYAPFDFAIQKNEEEVTLEKQKIKEYSKLYFVHDSEVKNSVFTAYENKILLIKETDSLSINQLQRLSAVGQYVIDTIYQKGFLEVASQDRVSSENEIVAIRKGNEVEDFIFKSFFTSKEVLELIRNSFQTEQSLYGKKALLDLLSEVVKPNIYFDREYTQKVIDNEIKNISYTKGKVASGKLIILKGDTVEGKKLAILNSLKSELTQLENNLEFFSNSSSENPLFKNVEKQIKSCQNKINRAQEDYIRLKQVKNSQDKSARKVSSQELESSEEN